MRWSVLTAAMVAAALAGCSGERKAETTTTTTNSVSAAPLQSAASPDTSSTAPLQPANVSVSPATGGYSCTFTAANGAGVLARFTLDGATARDDEGTVFQVLANSPTAVVLAKAREDVASPSGDVGAYLIAIDRRDLSMVQSSVGVRGAASSRRGKCIAG